MGARLGVLGGTFDPIHVGHRIVAQDVAEGLDLDRLIVVPAGEPPHRDATLPAEQRLEWTRRAFRGDGRIEVAALEVERPGPSYTVDTLEALRESRSPSRLFCVIGADQLEAFDRWRRPERIAEISRLTVINRGDREPRPPPALPELDYEPLEVTRVDLSSTRIRERVRDGRTVRYLVPDAVREEVERAYRADPVRA